MDNCINQPYLHGCFSVFILGYIICKTKKEKIKDNIFIKLLSAVPILFASIYIFMTVAYDNNNAKMVMDK